MRPGAISLAISRASLGRSRVWIMSNNATASAALFDWAADQMQLDARPAFPQAGQRRGLLDIVLAEHALTGGERCLDPRFGLRLGHGDQGDLGGRRPAAARPSIRAHLGQVRRHLAC